MRTGVVLPAVGGGSPDGAQGTESDRAQTSRPLSHFCNLIAEQNWKNPLSYSTSLGCSLRRTTP